MRNKFYTLKVVRHWHRLPGYTVDTPSLEAIKARLNGALGSLIYWEVLLPLQRVKIDGL